MVPAGSVSYAVHRSENPAALRLPVSETQPPKVFQYGRRAVKVKLWADVSPVRGSQERGKKNAGMPTTRAIGSVENSEVTFRSARRVTKVTEPGRAAPPSIRTGNPGSLRQVAPEIHRPKDFQDGGRTVKSSFGNGISPEPEVAGTPEKKWRDALDLVYLPGPSKRQKTARWR